MTFQRFKEFIRNKVATAKVAIFNSTSVTLVTQDDNAIQDHDIWYRSMQHRTIKKNWQGNLTIFTHKVFNICHFNTLFFIHFTLIWILSVKSDYGFLNIFPRKNLVLVKIICLSGTNIFSHWSILFGHCPRKWTITW